MYEGYEFYTLYSKIVDVLNKEYYHTMKNIYNVQDVKPFDIIKLTGLTIDKLISEENILEGQKYTSEVLEIEQNYVIPDLKQKSSLLEEETEENPLPKIGEFDVMGEVMVNGKMEKYGIGGEIIGEDK